MSRFCISAGAALSLLLVDLAIASAQQKPAPAAPEVAPAPTVIVPFNQRAVTYSAGPAGVSFSGPPGVNYQVSNVGVGPSLYGPDYLMPGPASAAGPWVGMPPIGIGIFGNYPGMRMFGGRR